MSERLPSHGLKEVARSLGFDQCGVCEPVPPPHLREYVDWINQGRHGEMSYLADQMPLKQHPSHLLPGVRSIVAVSLNYYQPSGYTSGEPRIARYAFGRDYHKVVRGKLNRLSRWIENKVPGSLCRPCVDSAPIFERDYAHLAGLGWFGKNTMLIDSRRGSWFFIGLLLTTAAFELDTPSVGGCGNCKACVEACPTGAIKFESGRWQVDARDCISYQTIEKRGDLSVDTDGWTFGCDVCQEVCPFNTPRSSQPLRSAMTREPDFLANRTWPSLQRLAVISESEWDELTRGSAIRRTGLTGLRRNARANLDAVERPVPAHELRDADL